MKKKAGFIPYYEHNGITRFMFMVPSDPAYGGDRPQVAKGTVDEGETDIQAALREASEELGLKTSNIDHTTIKRAFGQIQPDKFSFVVYIGRVKSMSDFDKPHYETGSVHWLTEDEFMNKGRPEHKHIVVSAAMCVNRK